MPFAIRFHDDILNTFWSFLEDFVEVAVKHGRLTNSLDSVGLKISPVNYEVFVIQCFFANWAKPGRSLFHHGKPGCGIKALRMNTF